MFELDDDQYAHSLGEEFEVGCPPSHKLCAECGTPFLRDGTARALCSETCKQARQQRAWDANNARMMSIRKKTPKKAKKCRQCKKSFIPTSNHQVDCAKIACKREALRKAIRAHQRRK
jgi:hypothetical protein